MKTEDSITLFVQDMTGQREFPVPDVPREASWGEVMAGVLARMSLPQNTAGGDAAWTGRLEREGRHLHTSEIVGEALRNEDRIVLQREANAG